MIQYTAYVCFCVATSDGHHLWTKEELASCNDLESLQMHCISPSVRNNKWVYLEPSYYSSLIASDGSTEPFSTDVIKAEGKKWYVIDPC